jgi:hypothetical protein
MVSSIRFWMRSFDIIDDNDEITEFGDMIFVSKSQYNNLSTEDKKKLNFMILWHLKH